MNSDKDYFLYKNPSQESNNVGYSGIGDIVMLVTLR